jgi:hypothetical protein
MLRTIRRTCTWGMGHGFKLLAGFLVVGFGLSLLKPPPAEADASVDGLKSVALSGVGLNQRLLALEALREAGSTGALAALEDVAKTGDVRVASGACAQIGLMESSASKARLKAVLEDSRTPAAVRRAAASSIAAHWKDSGDLTYLEGRCNSDTALGATVSWLRTHVYEE